MTTPRAEIQVDDTVLETDLSYKVLQVEDTYVTVESESSGIKILMRHDLIPTAAVGTWRAVGL